jgi:hypothetical protein
VLAALECVAGRAPNGTACNQVAAPLEQNVVRPYLGVKRTFPQ